MTESVARRFDHGYLEVAESDRVTVADGIVETGNLGRPHRPAR